MAEIKVMWECSCCNDLHDDEDDALDCCRPSANEVFLCPVCDEAHDSMKEAQECLVRHSPIIGSAAESCPCCWRPAETAQSMIEIAVAGHCGTCNPIFTVEQNLAILDAVHPRH